MVDQIQYDAVVAERDQLREKLNTATIQTEFAQSNFVRERLTIPAGVAAAFWSKSFRVEDGRVVGVDQTGATMLSRENPGEVASFDEGLDDLVRRNPHAHRVTGPVGGHAKSSLSRSSFGLLSPADQMAHVKAGGTVHD